MLTKIFVEKVASDWLLTFNVTLGIAQKLMQAFEKYVVDNKYQQIVLSTLVENIPGRKFYESIGFKLVKEGKYPNEIRVAYYCKEFLI